MNLQDIPQNTDCRLRTSVRQLSAGTRVITLSEVGEHGYVTVIMRTAPSKGLLEQGRIPHDGIFDIEFDYLQPVRNREATIHGKQDSTTVVESTKRDRDSESS